MGQIVAQTAREVGAKGATFAGRLSVREFGGSLEAIFTASEAPSFRERVDAFLASDGETSLGAIPPPFAGMGNAPKFPEETDRERAMRRARQVLRWKIKAIGADRLLTITHRDNIEDYQASRKIMAKFIAMCRREWSSWRYVGIPEPQERGAWHWHFAVPGWVNVDKLRGFWWRAHGRRVVFSEEGKPVLCDGGKTPGNIDIQMPRRSRTRKRWDPDRLAGYLQKYLGKELGEDEALKGRASYLASRGITWTVRRWWVFADNFGEVCSHVFDAVRNSGGAVPFVWQSECRGVVWASALVGDSP